MALAFTRSFSISSFHDRCRRRAKALETCLLLRDPERGAIPRGASSLRLLNGRDLCEASRRSRLSRAAKGGLSRGGVGLIFWDRINTMKGRLEIGKPASMVPTYLVLSGKKSARSPPAEIFNSENHSKTHEPPFKTAESRPEIPEAPAALQHNGRWHIQIQFVFFLIGWFYSSKLPSSF
jgi:hypothetical protein